MAQCVEKISHECGSSDGLQVFLGSRDGYTGYCFACDTYVPDPYEEGKAPDPRKIKKKTEKDIEKEIKEIESLPSRALLDRKLRKETLERFGIKVGVSQQDGQTPVFIYFPRKKKGKVTGYQVKFIPGKKFWNVGDVKGCDLAGWDEASSSGARKFMITEGDLDMCALYQALKDKQKGTKYAEYEPAVCSLPGGASAADRDISRSLREIRSLFKEIILVFDNDEAGQEAVSKTMQIIPDAVSADLPCKDANECLIKGKQIALCNAVLFRSQTPKNTRLISADSLIEEARKPASMGFSWPWESFTQYTRGIRFGETYYIGAGVKMGKSELVNALAVHLMEEHNLPVFLVKPEEANKKTVKMVLGKVVGRIFHDPTVPFDEEAYDKAAKKIQGKLFMLNLYQHVGWNTLRQDILEAVNRGCKAVFIDPITNLTNGVPSAEANTKLQDIAQDLAALAKDKDIVVFIFCHLKAPESGAPHERGGHVYSHQFAGSRAMMRSCNYMIGMEGDKDPDKSLEERNIRKLVILEDREFGVSDYTFLYWNHETSLFTEIKKKPDSTSPPKLSNVSSKKREEQEEIYAEGKTQREVPE